MRHLVTCHVVSIILAQPSWAVSRYLGTGMAADSSPRITTLARNTTAELVTYLHADRVKMRCTPTHEHSLRAVTGFIGSFPNSSGGEEIAFGVESGKDTLTKKTDQE